MYLESDSQGHHPHWRGRTPANQAPIAFSASHANGHVFSKAIVVFLNVTVAGLFFFGMLEKSDASPHTNHRELPTAKNSFRKHVSLRNAAKIALASGILTLVVAHHQDPKSGLDRLRDALCAPQAWIYQKLSGTPSSRGALERSYQRK